MIIPMTSMLNIGGKRAMEKVGGHVLFCNFSSRKHLFNCPMCKIFVSAIAYFTFVCSILCMHLVYLVESITNVWFHNSQDFPEYIFPWGFLGLKTKELVLFVLSKFKQKKNISWQLVQLVHWMILYLLVWAFLSFESTLLN